jgi:hypothetical protein
VVLIRSDSSISDIALELAQIDLLLKPTIQLSDNIQRPKGRPSIDATYNSSISPGVRRVTSGRINQAIITEMVPVPAKLFADD